MYDQSEVLDVEPSIEPQTLGSSTTVNGSGVDLKGFHAATVLIDVGAYTDGSHAFEVQEANDDGTGSPDTWAAVADADLEGSEPTVDASGEGDEQYRLGYTGGKRHLRVSVTSSSVTTGLADVVAYVIRGIPADAPVSRASTS